MPKPVVANVVMPGSVRERFLQFLAQNGETSIDRVMDAFPELILEGFGANLHALIGGGYIKERRLGKEASYRVVSTAKWHPKGTAPADRAPIAFQIRQVLSSGLRLSFEQIRTALPNERGHDIKQTLDAMVTLDYVKRRQARLGGRSYSLISAKKPGKKPAHPDADTVILKAEPKISSSWWAGKSRVDFSAAHKERFGA